MPIAGAHQVTSMLLPLAARRPSFLASFALWLVACQPLASPAGPDASPPGVDASPARADGGDAGPGGTVADVAQYNALEQQLSSNATTLVPSNNGPSSPSPVGSQLFYMEFPAEMPTQPTLHRYDDTAHSTLDYTFGIGTTDQDTPYNWSASATLVTTVDTTGDTPVINAYNSSDANTLVGSLTLPQPASGEIFQANAIDGSNVYYIDDSGDPVLVEWVAGASTTTTDVLTFSNVGVDATEALNFTVSGNQVLLEDFMGGLWNIDIVTQKATSIGNMTQATGGTYDANGFLYTTGSGTSTGLYYYTFATGKTTDVAAAIVKSSYSLNATYSMIHYYSSGAAIQNGVVYYIGEANGLYSFTLSTSKVTPLLLAPQDDSIEYQSPTILDDGTLIVLGVNTNDPGTNAGTLYRVASGGS